MVTIYGWPDTDALPEPEDVEGEEAVDALLELLEMSEPDHWRASRTTDSELHWKITTAAFDRAYKWTDGAFHQRGPASTAQQRRVRMLTGIDADVERFLESENPYEQAWILYERLYQVQREWAGTG